MITKFFKGSGGSVAIPGAGELPTGSILRAIAPVPPAPRSKPTIKIQSQRGTFVIINVVNYFKLTILLQNKAFLRLITPKNKDFLKLLF